MFKQVYVYVVFPLYPGKEAVPRNAFPKARQPRKIELRDGARRATATPGPGGGGRTRLKSCPENLTKIEKKHTQLGEKHTT